MCLSLSLKLSLPLQNSVGMFVVEVASKVTEEKSNQNLSDKILNGTIKKEKEGEGEREREREREREK